MVSASERYKTLSTSGGLDGFSEAVRSIFEGIRAAANYFDYSKPSSSYTPKPRVEVYRSRRTGEENLILFKFYIPETRVGQTPSVVIVAAYRSFNKPVSKFIFERSWRYIWRTVEEFTEEDRGFEEHIFIYFAGEGFRAGVEEAKRAVNGGFKESGVNAKVRLVDLRFRSLGDTIRRDLIRYLGSRAWRLIESLGGGRDGVKVRGSVKSFLDFVALIVSRLTDLSVYRDVQDISKRGEALLSVYRAILEKLSVGPPKRRSGGSERSGGGSGERPGVSADLDRPLIEPGALSDRFIPVAE
ncbi:MAG: hypothetical protein BA066_07910 [Candidatus Korarchaeota archaeon NZ13-K]|nr:MAG: hypothetical protein BA066_07910 [Candidatus Korarchaeota archaeon NZ13-K]